MSSQKADAAEYARLAARRRYRILDTEPEQQFDDLTMLASHVCGAPISLITLDRELAPGVTLAGEILSLGTVGRGVAAELGARNRRRAVDDHTQRLVPRALGEQLLRALQLREVVLRQGHGRE